MKSETHRKRMDERRANQHARKSDYYTPPLANVGREHPDHGMHPHDHMRHKAARNSVEA